jgi:hypothetical protein
MLLYRVSMKILSLSIPSREYLQGFSDYAVSFDLGYLKVKLFWLIIRI